MSTDPTNAPARTWHKGPPPHVGWWNASSRRLPDYWRWWDGAAWSGSAMGTDSATDALEWALHPGSPIGIEWSDYYPADARVPRLNPDEGWVLNTGRRPEHAGRIEVAFTNGSRNARHPALSWSWTLPNGTGSWLIYAWRPAP